VLCGLLTQQQQEADAPMFTLKELQQTLGFNSGKENVP
jgi:hypothetical protein